MSRYIHYEKASGDIVSISEASQDVNSGETSKRSTKGKSSELRVYEAKFFLCPKKTKYLKGTRTRVELVKCTTLGEVYYTCRRCTAANCCNQKNERTCASGKK